MNEASISSLVIPEAGQQFIGSDFRDLRKPGVYVFMLKGQPLYVGMGSMLLRRIGAKHYQATQAIDECDQVLLYPCVSIKAAQQLEALLISKLQPKYNWRQRSKALRDRLGLSNWGANRIQRERLVSSRLSFS